MGLSAGVDDGMSTSDFKNALQDKSGIASERLEILTGFPPTILQVCAASALRRGFHFPTLVLFLRAFEAISSNRWTTLQLIVGTI